MTNILFGAVCHLHVGKGDDADSAVRPSRGLPQVLHQDDPVGDRRPRPASQVYRLSRQRAQTGLEQERGEVFVDATAVVRYPV